MDASQNTGSGQSFPLLTRVEEEVQRLKQAIDGLKLAKEELESESPTGIALDEVESEVNRLMQLYRIKEVLTIFKESRKLHEAIEYNLREKSGKNVEADMRLLQAVDEFHQLAQVAGRVFSVAPAHNFLYDYIKRMLMYWYEQLLNRLAPRFEKLYEAAHWPVVSIESTTGNQPAATSAFDNFFVALLKIEVRDIAPDHKPIQICLPIELMLKPFKKRFMYHFMGTARTNQIEKPEWYLTQILTWYKDNSGFLVSNVDPLLRMHEKDWMPAATQLMIGFMQMIKEKLETDIDELVYDDKNFSHTVDEIYLFLKEVKPLLDPDYDYVRKCCDIFSVFCEEPCFSKLLNIEKKRSSDYVDTILQSPTAWSRITEDLELEEEDRKVPESADSFIILLQTIIERSLVIRESHNRQPFVDLVIELMNDFHLRLSQLIRPTFGTGEDDGCSSWPFSDRFFAIINSMQYLSEVMENWRCLPFIMESDFSEERLQSTILQYQHVIKEKLMPRTIDGFTNELRIQMAKFSDVRWFCLNPDASDEGSVDFAECEVLHFVSSALQLCRRQLMHSISDHVCRLFAKQVNDVLMQEVLLKNTFNTPGAVRIHRHVHQKLLTIFKNFISNPEVYFAESREATTVLRWDKGVKEMLAKAGVSDDPESLLTGMDIHLLSLDLVKSIMSRRIYTGEQ